MKNLLLLSVILFVSGYTSCAQKSGIYLPREYQKALKNNTRNITGAPGEKYFQNRADYQIDAAFDPQTRILSGSETITYLNNSPDSLKIIILNIDHDIFRAGTNRVYEVEAVDLTDGVEFTGVKINGETVAQAPPLWQRDGTEVYVRLQKPLAPKGTLRLELSWNLIHPLKTQMRTGTYDSLSFFIAFWFPRIAVYDDVFGWDYTQHLGSGEFYNDFGNFDVSMTIPGDYLMWSTGELQNGSELLTPQTIARLEKARETGETLTIASFDDLKKDRVLKPGNTKKWHYKAGNVTDFAFGISPVYQWDQQYASLPDGRRVPVNAAYPEKAEDFKEVAAIGAKTLEMMSGEITGVSYPFPAMTVFCGHGGMEFPMIVNDGPGDERTFTVFVTAHEISHTWFPFLAGLNETRYGWMDEGLITFLPKKIEETYFPEVNPHRSYMRSYANWAGREDDINMSVPSNSIANTSAYRMNVYGRAAAAFYHLGDAMGEANFRMAIKTFLNEWAFKHPSPYDFMNTCSRISGEDLSWYFSPWFYSNGYPDLAIGKVETGKGNASVTINRKGDIPVPLLVRFKYNDGTVNTYKASVRSWKDGTDHISVEIPGVEKLTEIELGDANIPDAFPKDNSWLTPVNN
ncbi:MAG: M1 family metallopeptidase [Bacteroidales bacterium]|nr:M1 family metallopeptidase [Bacteroidales bacterium]